jgi:hypothetical protein
MINPDHLLIHGVRKLASCTSRRLTHPTPYDDTQSLHEFHPANAFHNQLA